MKKSDILKGVPKKDQKAAWFWYTTGHAAGYRCCYDQMNKASQQNLMKLAKDHVRPLGKGVEILKVERIDDRTFYVEFKHKGSLSQQYVGI